MPRGDELICVRCRQALVLLEMFPARGRVRIEPTDWTDVWNVRMFQGQTIWQYVFYPPDRLDPNQR